jgi:hypothetical protein
LSRATILLHVDIHVGNPIWPEPQQVRLLDSWTGTCSFERYTLEMLWTAVG